MVRCHENKLRLLKPGMNGDYACIVDLVWESAGADLMPKVIIKTIKVTDFEPDQTLMHDVDRANSIIDHLTMTDLTIIPQKYKPLTSRNVRENRSTMEGFHFFIMLFFKKAPKPNER